MKSTSNSGSSHNVADDDLKISEMVETKRTMAVLLDGMDAFDDFLKLTANVEAPQTSGDRLRIDVQTQGILDDDDTSFFSDDSDDESSSKNMRHRVVPVRGVRRDHSGDLERLFRPKCTVKDEMGSGPSQVIRHTTTDGAKGSHSVSKKPNHTKDINVIALSKDGRRTCSSTTNLDGHRPASDLIDDDNKAARTLSHHSAFEHCFTKSDESTGRRRGRRVQPLNSIMQQEANDVSALADPSCSVSQELSRTESRGELRRSRGDLSSSEHSSRPRLRRDALYATKRLTNSGTSDLDRTRIVRPNSEIDFQRASAAAAKKRQSAGRRISGGTTTTSPPRDGSSRGCSLRYSTSTNRISSAELSELSPLRLPRSNTSGTNLLRSAGPKRSFNNLNLVGVYSNGAVSSMSPKRTVEDLRRSLKKNGGRNDIDDLVVKMTRDVKPSGLETKQANASWN